jgi:hypothetical protein
MSADYATAWLRGGVAGERPRGSTALFGNTDVVIKIENDEGLVRASFDKIRNGARAVSRRAGRAHSLITRKLSTWRKKFVMQTRFGRISTPRSATR